MSNKTILFVASRKEITESIDLLNKTVVYSDTENGKVGLFQYCGENQTDKEIIPYIYDNIFLLMKRPVLVILKKGGFYGAVLIYEKGGTVQEDYILQCKYDSIDNLNDNGILILRKQTDVFLYDCENGYLSKEYNSISYLELNFYLFEDEAMKYVWDKNENAFLFSIEKNEKCEYVGNYDNGYVFRIDECGYQITETENRSYVVFVEQKTHLVKKTGKTTNLSVVSKENTKAGKMISSIEFKWGDFETLLQSEDIDSICDCFQGEVSGYVSI